MGGFWNAVIPALHKEFPGNADADFMASGPSGAKAAVGFRVNDVTSGTSVSIDDQSGTAVVYDNMVAGEEIAGRFQAINNTGTTADSIIVYYV